MSKDLELERTYLLKKFPEGLTACKSVEILDLYLPSSTPHPKLRIRRKGNNIELTKKIQLSSDASVQEEHTIPLTEEEFKAMSVIPVKKVRKIRYYFPTTDQVAEIDVFQDELAGLVVADFEFNSPEGKENFTEPDFCLVDVTQEEFIAGGYLAGKSYLDIEKYLKRYNYIKLTLE